MGDPRRENLWATDGDTFRCLRKARVRDAASWEGVNDTPYISIINVTYHVYIYVMASVKALGTGLYVFWVVANKWDSTVFFLNYLG